MTEISLKIIALLPQLAMALALLLILLILAKNFEGRNKIAAFFTRAFGKGNTPPPTARSQIIIFAVCGILILLPIIFKFALSESQRQYIVEWIQQK